MGTTARAPRLTSKPGAAKLPGSRSRKIVASSSRSYCASTYPEIGHWIHDDCLNTNRECMHWSREVKEHMLLLREQGTSCSLFFFSVPAGIGNVLQEEDRRGRGRMVDYSPVNKRVSRLFTVTTDSARCPLLGSPIKRDVKRILLRPPDTADVLGAIQPLFPFN